MSVLIETQDLKKYFKTPRGWLHAVDGIDFQIQTGEHTGRCRGVRLREIHAGPGRPAPS